MGILPLSSQVYPLYKIWFFLKISYPTSSSVGRFHGDVTFCKNTNSALGSPNMCDFTCMCPNTAECSEIIVFLANSDNAGMGATWSLCGLTALNIWYTARQHHWILVLKKRLADLSMKTTIASCDVVYFCS